MDLTEAQVLEAIRRLLHEGSDDVVVGVGDDAAVVRSGSGDLVLTTDSLVEGRHFELDRLVARDLGAKAIAVTVSDVAAMAASPRFAVCALTLSEGVDATWVTELFGGMREACDEYGLRLVGGNLVAGAQVGVNVTVTGEVAPGRAVTRSGARVGDRVVVTGELGGAAAGLLLGDARGGSARRSLARGRPAREAQVNAIRRHVRPTARVGEAAVLASHGATAMIDVSDGLGMDLGRISAASGVGVVLLPTEIPVDPAATLEEAMGGGEDYELVATLPTSEAVGAARDEIRKTYGIALTEIGAIVEGAGITTPDGAALAQDGWDHFS